MALLPALRVPGVADLDAMRGLDDVVIARGADDPVRAKLAHREGQHMSRSLALEGLRNIGLRLVGLGHRGEPQLPELSVGGRFAQLSRMLFGERLEAHAVRFEHRGTGVLHDAPSLQCAQTGMDKQKQKQAIDQVLRDMAGAMTAGLALVGTRTGLFRAMAGKGGLTPAQVGKESGLARRYFEEWFKGLVSAGYLDYEGGKYALPAETAYFVAPEGPDPFVGG